MHSCTLRDQCLLQYYLCPFRVLHWVRSSAPIIIHINLDRVLSHLTKDTHYRNLFEIGTGCGSTDKTARTGWEVRTRNIIQLSMCTYTSYMCITLYMSIYNCPCAPVSSDRQPWVWFVWKDTAVSNRGHRCLLFPTLDYH